MNVITFYGMKKEGELIPSTNYNINNLRIIYIFLKYIIEKILDKNEKLIELLQILEKLFNKEEINEKIKEETSKEITKCIITVIEILNELKISIKYEDFLLLNIEFSEEELNNIFKKLKENKIDSKIENFLAEYNIAILELVIEKEKKELLNNRNFINEEHEKLSDKSDDNIGSLTSEEKNKLLNYNIQQDIEKTIKKQDQDKLNLLNQIFKLIKLIFSNLKLIQNLIAELNNKYNLLQEYKQKQDENDLIIMQKEDIEQTAENSMNLLNEMSEQIKVIEKIITQRSDNLQTLIIQQNLEMKKLNNNIIEYKSKYIEINNKLKIIVNFCENNNKEVLFLIQTKLSKSYENIENFEKNLFADVTNEIEEKQENLLQEYIINTLSEIKKSIIESVKNTIYNDPKYSYLSLNEKNQHIEYCLSNINELTKNSILKADVNMLNQLINELKENYNIVITIEKFIAKVKAIDINSIKL